MSKINISCTVPFIFTVYSSQHLNNAVTGKEITHPGLNKVGEAINVDVALGVILRHAIDNQLTGKKYHYDHARDYTYIITEWVNPVGTTIYIAAIYNAQEVNG